MTASTPDAYTVIRRVFDEGFCTGNEAIVDELFSPDQVEHQFGLNDTGAAAIQNVKDAIANDHSIAPDLACMIEAPATDGDLTWTRVVPAARPPARSPARQAGGRPASP